MTTFRRQLEILFYFKTHTRAFPDFKLLSTSCNCGINININIADQYTLY